ncbi:SnoaL-like domain containing protein [Nitzschia inconspicua]|uniref:SnoaL-like domain containing protein n=1 Tax=Nitzschia inconspicua TaxID=303405 RepID=A0A9K3PNU4_9STRA|nr:SnoaL-like domain containing protein [Nitzschia inconspicua]
MSSLSSFGYCIRGGRRSMSVNSRRILPMVILLFMVAAWGGVPCTGFHLSYQQGVSNSGTGWLTRRRRNDVTKPRLSSFLHANSPKKFETTGQDPVLRLPLMEAELATLMEINDKETQKRQEELQGAISDAKTAAEFGVRKAQLEFYDAFSKGDMAAMEKVWSTKSHVRCVHPGMVSLEGRDKVMASWRQIFLSGGGGEDSSNNNKKKDSSFEIEPIRSQVEVHGLIALCSCVEKTQGGGSLEALNVYKREEGAWKMTLHMASPTVVSIRGGDAFF